MGEDALSTNGSSDSLELYAVRSKSRVQNRVAAFLMCLLLLDEWRLRCVVVSNGTIDRSTLTHLNLMLPVDSKLMNPILILHYKIHHIVDVLISILPWSMLLALLGLDFFFTSSLNSSSALIHSSSKPPEVREHHP